MSQTSEQERYLIARGDIAIVALKAVLNALTPTLDTNERTATQLQAIQAKQPQGGVTLLSVVSEVTTKTALTLSTTVELVKQTLAELDAFSASTEIATDDTAVENVLNAIRESSEVYRNKTDEELKRIIGL